MRYLDKDLTKQTFFLALILLLGGVLFWKMTYFIPAVLGALTLYVLLRPVQFYLVERRHWGRTLSASLLMLISFLVLLVPIGLFINMTYGKIGQVVANSGQLMSGLHQLVTRFKLFTTIDLLSAASIQKAQNALDNFLPQFLGSTFNVVSTLIIMYFILYFMLVEARKMEHLLYEYIPLKEENVLKLGKEVKNMVISNAVGIPLLGLVQALFALIGYWVFSAPDVLFWAVITGFMSMLPVVGTAAVWVPMGLYLMMNVSTWKGVALLIYGVLIIVNMDNLFRMVWQKKIADVHPLITVFGVLIGVNLFGFVGLIFGPLLISLFLLLLKIYRDEFSVQKIRHKTPPAESATEK